MATQVYISADSLLPSNHLIELSYSYGPGPAYSPIAFDPVGNGEQASLVCAGNTRTMFQFGSTVYRLLNRQQTFGTVLCASTDNGASWAVLDSANSPAFETCSGCFDLASETLYCAFVAANGAGGAINLRNFDLTLGTWGPVYGTVGAPASAQSAGIGGVWLRPDNTLLVIFDSRDDFVGTNSGIGAAVYNLTTGVWSAPFDVGAALLGLAGWDHTLTVVLAGQCTSVVDPAGIAHVFFRTASTVISPTWNNRCFYQQILLDGSLGAFFDFPGQTAPFPPFPYNTQQLNAFSGSPMGQPVIVGDLLVLPVLMRNDSTVDRFPQQLANVYVGSPLANPVWVLNTGSTIDPGALADDTIFPQEAPAAYFDGQTIYAVFSAQDSDGQNFARLRLAQTSNLGNPAAGWSAVTAFDLQVNAPLGFQFAEQQLVAAAVFVPATARAQSVVITLYGWKLCRDSACDTAPAELPEIPHIDRAV